MKLNKIQLLASLILMTVSISDAELIYSWEAGLDGWTNNDAPAASVATSTIGATQGVQSMAVSTPMSAMWYAVPATVRPEPAALNAIFTDATELKLDVSFPDPGFSGWISQPTVEIIIQGANLNWLPLGEKPVTMGAAPQTISWPLSVGQAAAMASGGWGQILLKFTYGHQTDNSANAIFYVDNFTSTIVPEPPPTSNFFWNGAVNNSWAAPNWASDGAGTTPGGTLPQDGSAGIAFSALEAINEDTLLGANQRVKSVVVNDGAGFVNIGGTHALHIGGGGIWLTNGSSGLNIDTTGGVVLSENQMWKNKSIYEMTVDSQLSGPGALTKGGAGSLFLGSANLHTGGTIVQQGLLTIGNESALGPVTAALNMNGGALDLYGYSPTLGEIAGSSGAVIRNSTEIPCVLTLENDVDSAFSCSINNGSGAGGVSFVKKGMASVTVNGAGDFTGPLTIEDGQYIANAGIYGAPNSSSLGSGQTAGRKITVLSPGSLLLGINNVFGNASADPALLPEIILDGSAMYSNRYNLVGDITIKDGELANSSTDNGDYLAYQFKGRIKVMGSTVCYISGSKGNHLSTNTVFDVGNVTGDPFEDLLITTPLVNQSGDFALAPGGLTKTGPGNMALLGTCSYTGDTHVDEGILTLIAPALSDSGLLEVAGGAIIHLDFEGTDTVGMLKLGADMKGDGVYGAMGSGAQFESALITGTGFIEVGVSDAYATWISGYPSLSGDSALRGSDPDHDGLTNLQEFAFNSIPDNGASSGRIRIRVEAVGSEQALVITLPVRDGAVFVGDAPATAVLAAEKLTYQIGGSDNLTAFDKAVSEVSPSSGGLPDLDAGWTYRGFRLNGSIGGNSSRGPRGFLRAAVIDTP